FLALALSACAAQSDDPGDLLGVNFEAATAIPPDGTCIHIVATSMASFKVAGEYVGDTSAATMKLKAGDYRFDATAYPPPCNPPSASPPYPAEPAIAQVTSAAPTVTLKLHNTVQTGFDINFLSDLPEAMQLGTSVRTGANGEDASGPGYSLDF